MNRWLGENGARTRQHGFVLLQVPFSPHQRGFAAPYGHQLPCGRHKGGWV